MAVEITKEVLQEFKRITSADIEGFFNSAISFFTTSYNRIVAYYSGDVKQASQADFLRFQALEDKRDVMFSVFHTQASKLSNLKWHLLLDHVEDIDTRLRSLRKINKWSKSSITNFGYNPSLQATYTLKSNQTLERVANDILNQSDPDAWVDIALQNQLIEEDYTPAGGVGVQLGFPVINRGINISSVVDVMIDKNILGKDFNRNLHFNSNTGDLEIVEFDDCVKQAVEILANLRRNDNPDFPDQGLQSSVVVGSNRASLNFPIITRQYQKTFASDDSLKSFQLLTLDVQEDNLNISFQVQTRLNESIDGTIVI